MRRALYDHPAREYINEDRTRECLRCGQPVTGAGETLRHVGEVVRPAALSERELAAVRSAADVVEAALAAMPTDRCADGDRARVAAEALHLAGMLAVARHRRPVRAA